jgi:ATP-dependent DNA helicase RecQ
MKLLVIDEAHCISECGDNFRQEYQQLSELRSFLQTPVMALTATSTKKVKAYDVFFRFNTVQTYVVNKPSQ